MCSSDLSLEIGFPVGLPKDLGVRGAAFTDFGSLWKSGLDDPGVFDTPALRASYGVGLSWLSPLGLLRFDFAWPLKKQEYDRTERFRFSLGTRF